MKREEAKAREFATNYGGKETTLQQAMPTPTPEQQAKLEEALLYAQELVLHKDHSCLVDHTNFTFRCDTCKQTMRFYIPQGSPSNQVMVEWSGNWHIPLWYFKSWHERRT